MRCPARDPGWCAAGAKHEAPGPRKSSAGIAAGPSFRPSVAAGRPPATTRAMTGSHRSFHSRPLIDIPHAADGTLTKSLDLQPAPPGAPSRSDTVEWYLPRRPRAHWSQGTGLLRDLLGWLTPPPPWMAAAAAFSQVRRGDGLDGSWRGAMWDRGCGLDARKLGAEGHNPWRGLGSRLMPGPGGATL